MLWRSFCCLVVYVYELTMALQYVILIALVLFVVGLFAGRKLPSRWRLVWLIPAVLVPGLLVMFGVTKREYEQQARALFGRLESGRTLSAAEADALRVVAESSPKVRARVIELAFASNTNALIALPRFALLLQTCVGLESSPKDRERFWTKVVTPAIRKRESLPILRLAAASADLLQLGSNSVTVLIEPLIRSLQNETDPATRAELVHELGALADRMAPLHARIIVDAVVRQMAEEKSTSELGPLFVVLTRALSQLEPVSAQVVASNVLLIMETSTNAFKSMALAEGLAPLHPRMTPDQPRRVAEKLAGGWLGADGRPQAVVVKILPDLVVRLPADDVESIVKLLISKTVPHSYDRNHQYWAQAFPPLLTACAKRMTPEQTVGVLAELLQGVREPWSDLVWAGIINPLASDLAPSDLQLLANGLADRIFASEGMPMRWFVRRFAAVASHMESVQAAPLADLMVSKLLASDGDPDALLSYSVVLCKQLDEPAANGLAGCVLPAMQNAEGMKLLHLAEVLGAMADKLESACADRVITKLVPPILSGKNIYRVSRLAEVVSPFASSMRPELVQLVIERLVTGLESETDIDGFGLVTSGLAPFAEHMNETHGIRAGHQVIAAIQKDPLKVLLRSNAVQRVASRMQPDQAKRAAELLLARGLGRLGPDIHWASKTPLVAAALTSELAEMLANDVTAPLPRQNDLSTSCRHIRAVMPFVAKLQPDQIRRVGDRLLKCVEGDTNYVGLTRLLTEGRGQRLDRWRSPRVFVAREESMVETWALKTLFEGLATVLPKAQEQDAAEIAGRLASRFKQQAWLMPMPFEQVTADVLRYAPEQQLREVLQAPFAVGGLRQTVLRALEMKRQNGRLL
jgi:hypothetical protein